MNKVIKPTVKQRILLEAARNMQALAGKTSFRAKRDWNVTVDYNCGNFNAQFDRCVELGWVKLGKQTMGNWGPRNVVITEAGQKALKL